MYFKRQSISCFQCHLHFVKLESFSNAFKWQFVEVWSRTESGRTRRVSVVDEGLKPWGGCARWTLLRPWTSELWWSVPIPVTSQKWNRKFDLSLCHFLALWDFFFIFNYYYVYFNTFSKVQLKDMSCPWFSPVCCRLHTSFSLTSVIVLSVKNRSKNAPFRIAPPQRPPSLPTSPQMTLQWLQTSVFTIIYIYFFLFQQVFKYTYWASSMCNMSCIFVMFQMKFCGCQVEECHLPGLGVALTLDYRPDTADDAVSPLVSYVSGLLLGTNSKVRTWFSMFIRNGQQVNRVFHLFLNESLPSYAS